MARGVIVVGAGIAGIACAREIAAAGFQVRVLDRGNRSGGRMAVRHVEGRPIDVGAAYLTARDPAFQAVVDDWCERGLARPWVNSFDVYDAQGWRGVDAGPVRYAASHGLCSLVEDLSRGLDVRQEHDVSAVGPGPRVDGESADAVVLAMPEPQAMDVLADTATAVRAGEHRRWQPVLTLYAGWPTSCWDGFDGAFVNDDPVLAFVADDGSRRSDGAPVLVAHSTPEFAAPRLDEPAGARPDMVTALLRLLQFSQHPSWSRIKRWSLARPAEPRSGAPPYHLDTDMIALCGDSWGSPRVETAFLSGRSLGLALVQGLS